MRTRLVCISVCVEFSGGKTGKASLTKRDLLVTPMKQFGLFIIRHLINLSYMDIKDLQKAKSLMDFGASSQAAQLSRSLNGTVQTHFEASLILAEAQTEMLRQHMVIEREALLKSNGELIVNLLRHAPKREYELRAGYAGILLAIQLKAAGKHTEASGLTRMSMEACRGCTDKTLLGGEMRAVVGIVGGLAFVLDGEIDAARDCLGKADGLLGDMTGPLRKRVAGQVRSSLAMLAAQGLCPGEMVEVVHGPKVVAFTGHMMDKPGRSPARFTPDKEQKVTEDIRRALDEAGADICYGSGACGGDIIYLEQIHARGGEFHLVLPYRVETFKEHCLKGFLESEIVGRSWEERFDDLLSKARSVTFLGKGSPLDNSMVSECCNRVFLGLALREAEELSTGMTLIALWNGAAGDAGGGTAAMMDLAAKRGVDVKHLTTLRRPAAVKVEPVEPDCKSMPRPPGNALELPQRICAILFADVKGFSQMDESVLPNFLIQYFEPLIRFIKGYSRRCGNLLGFNTWGDGLYCVFDSAGAAGKFALELQEVADRAAWKPSGLGEDLILRVGLHAGAVYVLEDGDASGTAQGKRDFFGNNINFAARIEPITAPGEIYCSRPFAALAALEGVQEFLCEPVGDVSLPKMEGKYAMYVVRGRT